MSELGGKHRPVPYGRRDLRWVRGAVAAVTAAALVVPSILVHQDARQDLSEADRRITALESERWRVESDNDRLRGELDDLRGRLTFQQGAGSGPQPEMTLYQAPEPARTMPAPQPDRTRPRRSLTPSPAPSWHPVTPSPHPVPQQQPAEAPPSTSPSPPTSPTPTPTESPTECPAATVGDVLPCVINSLPLSVP